MTKAALALLIHGGTENWSPERWRSRFLDTCADRPVALWPAEPIDPDLVHYAAVWKPPAGALAAFKNLRVIFNLGAGVDALVADPSLPKVPLVRVVVGDLTQRMTEYVVLQVLMHHRQQLYLFDCQRHQRWAPKAQWAAGAIHVGVMGLGTLGIDSALVLRGLGFQVSGWSRGPKQIEGIESFAGMDELQPFLQQVDILVCLLPLTPDTRHILNRQVFESLNRSSPLGAPVLINAGRGGLQVQSDILDCLNDGTLGAASLDVFAAEPLPADDPLWRQPNLIITPHNAADTDPDAISRYVAQQIARFEAGGALDNVVDLSRGY